MTDEALDLADFIRERELSAELIAPGAHMPTVEAAAAAMGVSPDRIFKSVLFQAGDGRCLLVVACGGDRIDIARAEARSGFRGLRLAKPAVVLARTGYPAGGTPPVGHREPLVVLVDRRAAEQEWGYAGGGRPELLLKIASADILRLTGGSVADLLREPRDGA
jgi:prolyl-tRNA editing enzyme YbaK/EbsC (Cys-tRNA(Pro) deacylase)